MTRLGYLLHFGHNFLKPVATIILSKYPTLLGNFCNGVEIFHFSTEIIFGQLLLTFGDFLQVTLVVGHRRGGVIICVVCGAEVLAPATCYYCPFSLSKWKLKLETLIANESSFETVDQK